MITEIIKLITASLNVFSPFIQKGIVGVVNKVHNIYQYMYDVVDNSRLGIHRMMIIRIHNGGGNISSSRPTYSSVVYEECRKPLQSIRDRYQNIPADKFYMKMLQEVRLNGEFDMITEEMPECNLKNIYTIQHIKRVKVYFLREKKSGFLWRHTQEMHIAAIYTVNPHVTLNEIELQENMMLTIAAIKRNL